jgi:hypothetical protein
MKVSIILDRDKVLDGLPPSQDIALSFSEAQFNDIVARGGSYSSKVKVARTNNNVKHLGNLSSSQARDGLPYQRLSAEIKINDLTVYKGFATIQESAEYFQLRFFQGASDFFDLLGDTKLTELDLTDLDHDWTASNVNSKRASLDDVIYPNINYGRWTDVVKGTRPHTDFFPAVKMFTLLQRAADLYGWTIDSASGVTYLPFSKQDFRNITADFVKAKMSLSADFTTGGIDQSRLVQFDTLDYDPSDKEFSISSAPFPYDGFALRANGSYNIKLHIIIDEPAIGTINVDFVKRGVNPPIQTKSIVNPNNEAVDIELNGYAANESVYEVRVTTAVGGTAITIKAGSYFEIISGSEPINDGQLIHLADQMPDLKIRNLFLLEAVRQNALLITNAQTKYITYVPFNTIAARKPFAKDWSDKVDRAYKISYQFRLKEYAQTNFLKWAEGSDDDPIYKANNELGNSSFTIADENLKLEATAYESKYAASGISNVFTESEQCILIPRYSGSGTSYDEPDLDPKYRIAQAEVNNDFLVTITGETAPANQANLTFKDFDTVVSENYTAFTAAFDKAKILECYVRLDVTDINQLDITVPVFLEKEYWFILEVNQYQQGKSTKVKLLRL